MSEQPADRDQATRALEHELAALMRRIRRNIATRAKLVHPDLPTASYSMLRALNDAGPARSSELADTFAIDKGAVSRQVSLLEELGFVRRRPDPADGRAQQLSITELGAERLAEVDRIRRDWLEDRLAEWDTARLAAFAAELGSYNATLD